MGSWGTGLYSNDTASDVRDTCQEVFPFLSVEEGNEILFKEFEQNLNSVPMDDDEASFWYALADWQWKHGMLKEEIRQKTLSLLARYVGIEQWEESASASDVKKRKKVLDTLRERLTGEQPPLKVSKPKLRKPWHKPGDIWIFKTPTDSEYAWKACGLSFRKIYYLQNGEIRDAGICAADQDWTLDLREKYLAFLCVAINREPYSQYAQNVFDEDSVYAVYDFWGDHKPTIEQLSTTGFLPISANEPLKSNLDRTEWSDPKWHKVVWHYKFVGYGGYPKWHYTMSEVLHIDSEVVRFQKLAAERNIHPGASSGLLLHITPFEFLLTKAAYQKLGIQLNTLLDSSLLPLPCPSAEQVIALDAEQNVAEDRYRVRHGMSRL